MEMITNIHTWIHTYIVIVIVITTYHAVSWSYRAPRTDTWFLPRSIPWVPWLPEVAHCMTQDPEDWGYGSTGLWGQWQLQSFSISNNGELWTVGSPALKGQSIGTQHHSKGAFYGCRATIRRQSSTQAVKQGHTRSKNSI